MDDAGAEADAGAFLRLGDIGALVYVVEELDMINLIDSAAALPIKRGPSLGEMVVAHAVQCACATEQAVRGLPRFLDGALPRVAGRPNREFNAVTFHRVAGLMSLGRRRSVEKAIVNRLGECFEDGTGVPLHVKGTGTLARGNEPTRYLRTLSLALGSALIEIVNTTLHSAISDRDGLLDRELTSHETMTLLAQLRVGTWARRTGNRGRPRVYRDFAPSSPIEALAVEVFKLDRWLFRHLE